MKWIVVLMMVLFSQNLFAGFEMKISGIDPNSVSYVESSRYNKTLTFYEIDSSQKFSMNCGDPGYGQIMRMALYGGNANLNISVPNFMSRCSQILKDIETALKGFSLPTAVFYFVEYQGGNSLILDKVEYHEQDDEVGTTVMSMVVTQ